MKESTRLAGNDAIERNIESLVQFDRAFSEHVVKQNSQGMLNLAEWAIEQGIKHMAPKALKAAKEIKA